MKRIVGLYIAWLIAAVMLISAATERHPYSFYTLLRWICCPIFAYSALSPHDTKNPTRIHQNAARIQENAASRANSSGIAVETQSTAVRCPIYLAHCR